MEHSDSDSDGSDDINAQWYKVCRGNELKEGHRIHVEVNGRYITVFRSRGVLSSIDAGALELLYL